MKLIVPFFFFFFFAILRKRLKIIDLLTLSQLLPKLLPVFEIFGGEFRSPHRPPIPFPIVRSPRPLCNSWHRLCCVLLQSFQVIIQIPWSQLALCCCCCLLLPQDSWRMPGHFHQIELGKRDFPSWCKHRVLKMTNNWREVAIIGLTVFTLRIADKGTKCSGATFVVSNFAKFVGTNSWK